ncbi:MAG: helix-turn-helix domain-containing protein [Prevotella sp.]|nr:helix-turn-helix domain-containing protein [Prevotella sp.]
MAQIKTENEYRKLMQRIDELIEVVDDNTPKDDINYIELDLISDLVEEYEDIHYPIGTPSLVDTIKLRLYEMDITQAKLAEILGISPARVSDIMRGKCEPTLKVARDLCQKLNISPAVALGLN